MALQLLVARLARRTRAALERFEAPLHRLEPPPPPDPGAIAMQLEAAATGWFDAKSGEVVPGFPISAQDVVLDFGCGDTPFMASSRVAAAELILADIDAEKLATARAHVAAHNPSRLRILRVEDDILPLEDGSVTRVVATEVLEHVADPARAMRELVRVARSGALFLVSVPDSVSEELQRPFAPPGYFDPPNHVRVFDRETLRTLVEDAGLEILRTDLYGFYWTLWWCFCWACGEPSHPLLDSWTRTWGLLLQSRSGKDMKLALDRCVPKSQLVLARKA
jgi:SAM-dependent methyltransferase